MKAVTVLHCSKKDGGVYINLLFQFFTEQNRDPILLLRRVLRSDSAEQEHCHREQDWTKDEPVARKPS